MTQDRWTAIDRYLADRLLPADPALDAALADGAAAGLPAIDVSPPQGKLLHLLARIHGARTILELGTLGGVSTIWLARALPAGGRLVTLEVDPRHAAVARGNLERAGVADVVDVRVGPALETLPELTGPFDLVFIDADKRNTGEYLDRALELTRPGSLIVADNVVRAGGVLDADGDDPGIRGIRAFFDRVAAEPRLSGTAIQTVGSKGHDGFALLLVE